MQLVIFIAAVLSSAILTRWIRDFAIARNWVSQPSSARHIHTRAVPRFGGGAILLTLWAMVLLSWSAPARFGLAGMVSSHVALGILGPATLIFLLGLADDIFGLSPYTKFAVQTLAAILLYVDGFGISLVSSKTGGVYVGWLIGLPLTIIWVLLITNAFNLIDGLDGLAAGSALFSTLVICIIALLGHNDSVLFLTLVLAGAITGFLRYNFNPASIFLGDCGSLLIGFLLSAIALAGSQKSPTMVAVAIPIVSLGLPILDVTISVIRRFLSCKRLFDADREHIHHKLLGRGISHKQAVLVLYGVSACFGLLSLFLLHPATAGAITVLMVVVIGVLIGVRQLRYHEFVELGRAANRALNQRHVIANDISIRRAADVLQSCTTRAHFCQILQEHLEPVGFDGFGVYLSSELPAGVEVYPFSHAGASKLQFFWNHSVTSTETNWSLSFSLLRQDGQRLGGFTLYRKDTGSPLWMDPDVFTATGFSRALAAVVEGKLDSWFVMSHKEQVHLAAFEGVGTVIASSVRQPIIIPTSS